MTMRTYLVALSLLCLVSAALGFAPVRPQVPTDTSLNAVKYDKKTNRWFTDDPANEGPEAGYDIAGSLLRSGPKAPIVRLTNPDKYEQAVLKYMAQDGVGRMEAQANMDQFFENAQDWMYYRIQGMRPDYVTIKKGEIAKRLVWTTIVVVLGGRAIVSLATGDSYWEPLENLLS